jgi:hypothetical protein
MKITASILAAVVLFLSTQCMIMGTNLAIEALVGEVACCSEKEVCEAESMDYCEETDTNDCDDSKCQDMCNPFMACCGSLYDVSRMSFDIEKPLAISVKNGCRDMNLQSTYISGLWQPPEFVE